MKNEGFGYLKPGYLPYKTSKDVGLGGPWYLLEPITAAFPFGFLGTKHRSLSLAGCRLDSANV